MVILLNLIKKQTVLSLSSLYLIHFGIQSFKFKDIKIMALFPIIL